MRNPNATVSSITDLLSLGSLVSRIVIDNGINESCFTRLDFSGFPKLKALVIGNHCFMYVYDIHIAELSELESVAIGNGCFLRTQEFVLNGLDKLETIQIGENSFSPRISDNREHRFCLNSCPKVRRLIMGSESFAYYSVCVIEKVDALEVIEMGRRSFNHASLELKSVIVESE